MHVFSVVAAGSSTAAHAASAAKAAQTTGTDGSGASAGTGASNPLTGASSDLNKDAFLKLLVTQLQYQDPSNPMDNREFISQMAQFSSLEQMTNVRDGLDVLTQMQISTQALTLVGREVSLSNPGGGAPISGKVDEVKFMGGQPRLVVDGKDYGLSDVLSVK